VLLARFLSIDAAPGEVAQLAALDRSADGTSDGDQHGQILRLNPESTIQLTGFGRRTCSLTLKRGGVMSDGREEREELEKRREQEKRENREDRIDRGDVDEWEPERVDS
jgi:hypothetical protein